MCFWINFFRASKTVATAYTLVYHMYNIHVPLRLISTSVRRSVSVEFLPAAREVENQTLQTHLPTFYGVSTMSVYLIILYEVAVIILSSYLLCYPPTKSHSYAVMKPIFLTLLLLTSGIKY